MLKNISVGRHKLKIDEFNVCRVFDFEILNSDKIRFKSSDLNTYIIQKQIVLIYKLIKNLGIIDIRGAVVGESF